MAGPQPVPWAEPAALGQNPVLPLMSSLDASPCISPRALGSAVQGKEGSRECHTLTTPDKLRSGARWEARVTYALSLNPIQS